MPHFLLISLGIFQGHGQYQTFIVMTSTPPPNTPTHWEEDSLRVQGQEQDQRPQLRRQVSVSGAREPTAMLDK